MQNTEKKTEKNTKKGFSFKNLTEHLKNKDEIEVRSRLRSAVGFVLTVAISYLLGGTELIFATYPLSIALLCSSRKNLLPVSIGIFILAVTRALPDVYVFTSIAIPLIRILVIYLPIVFAEMKKETQNGSSASQKTIIKYNPHLPEKKVHHEDSENDPSNTKKAVKIFNEPISMRAISAAIGGLICGIFLLTGSDFSFYTFWRMLSLVTICPFATFLLDGKLGDKSEHKIFSLISMAAISVGCVYAGRSLHVIGMPMAPFLAMLLTLYFTSAYGILYGGLFALILGLVFDPIYTPLLIICSILFFLISTVKRGAGLAVVCAAIVVWCYYIGGTSGLVSVLPPMLLSIPVYMITDKYSEIMNSPYDRSVMMAGGIYFAEAVTEKNKNIAVRDRLSALSDIFTTLSETFYRLSDKRRRPDALGIKKICETSFESTCDGCRQHEICYGNEYKTTLDAIGHAISVLQDKGSLEKSDLPESFLKLCPYADRLSDNINDALSRATESMITNDKLGFFASSYEDINEILNDALESDNDEYMPDQKSAERIFELLCEQGLYPKGAVVYGKRYKNIIIKGLPAQDKLNAKRSEEIRRIAESVTGVKLSEPVFEVCRDGSSMRLSSKPILRARCSYGNRPADTQKTEPKLDKTAIDIDICEENDTAFDGVCGDTSNFFVTGASYFYSLISDGMGSGEEAAFISGVCSMFIEKMLTAGNRADITVKMLNNVLRNENMGNGSECTATVDLFELDLISGTASFIKSGAAPTYIARGSTVYKVYSRTMPIGILKDADAKISKFDTQKGDIVIMLSDGCCPDSEDCPWLVEFLCEYMSKKESCQHDTDMECDALKEKLISLAVKNFPSSKENDDISISVIMIE